MTFVGSGEPERVSWARLHEDARAVAANLQAGGIGPGDLVALLGPTSRSLVTTIQATWLAGATVVVLPLPMRLGSVEEFVSQTRAMARSADVGLTLVDPDLAAFLDPEPGDPPVALLDEVAAGPGRATAAEFEPEHAVAASSASAFPDGASSASALPDGGSSASALPDGGSSASAHAAAASSARTTVWWRR